MVGVVQGRLAHRLDLVALLALVATMVLLLAISPARPCAEVVATLPIVAPRPTGLEAAAMADAAISAVAQEEGISAVQVEAIMAEAIVAAGVSVVDLGAVVVVLLLVTRRPLHSPSAATTARARRIPERSASTVPAAVQQTP